MLERLPGHLQQQTLLRIHRFGFAGADAEESRIELIDLFQQSGGRKVGAALRRRADRVPTLQQQLPECVGIAGAGETASHADDRDIRACCVEPGAGSGVACPVPLKWRASSEILGKS